MHVITITVPNPLGMPVGGSYLSEDVNAGEMLSRGWCRVEHAGVTVKKFDPALDWTGRRILFVRPGGFGDLLFMTPTFAELKRRFPALDIYVACFDRYRGALENNPDVTGFLSYPVPVDQWSGFDAHVWLEQIIEWNEKAHTTHAVDLIAGRVFGARWQVALGSLKMGAGKPDLVDRQMRYYVTGEERAAAETEFPRVPGKARIGFQMTASGGCRIYPHMGELSKLAYMKGHEVFLFGRPGELKTNEPEGLINLMQRGKTFRESCAILSTCDVVVAPDSALTHVAGALHIPCVAIYGPFPWETRTKYAPATKAIQGKAKCSPCFHHSGRGLGPFPAHGPCAKTGRCEVLAAIPMERVFREVEKKLGPPSPRLLRRDSSVGEEEKVLSHR